MQPSPLHYFPLAAPFLLAFFFFLAIVVAFVEIGVLEYAYERIGINRRYVFALLLLSLLGSYVNIPVAEIPGQKILANREIFYYGMLYVIPSVQELPRTIIALNVGGAVVPTLVHDGHVIRESTVICEYLDEAFREPPLAPLLTSVTCCEPLGVMPPAIASTSVTLTGRRIW